MYCCVTLVQHLLGRSGLGRDRVQGDRDEGHVEGTEQSAGGLEGNGGLLRGRSEPVPGSRCPGEKHGVAGSVPCLDDGSRGAPGLAGKVVVAGSLSGLVAEACHGADALVPRV